MNLKILSLNCQWAYNREVKNFLRKILETGFYDFLLLQEANPDVLTATREAKDYEQLGAFNEGNQKQSWICILYKKNFILKQTSFVSFSGMSAEYSEYPQLGFLMGAFKCNGETMTLGSVHLHPSYHFRLRALDIKLVKKHILINADSKTPIIFGGDFNTGFPLEGRRMRKILSPEFFDGTEKNGPTLNSRYTEHGTHFVSRAGNVLASAGIGISFRTDKIFIDRKTAGQHRVATRVFPDRISDHSPVELILKN